MVYKPTITSHAVPSILLKRWTSIYNLISKFRFRGSRSQYRWGGVIEFFIKNFRFLFLSSLHHALWWSWSWFKEPLIIASISITSCLISFGLNFPLVISFVISKPQIVQKAFPPRFWTRYLCHVIHSAVIWIIAAKSTIGKNFRRAKWININT